MNYRTLLAAVLLICLAEKSLACVVKSVNAIERLLNNSILKEERYPVELEDIGALTHIVVQEVDVGDFTISELPRNQPVTERSTNMATPEDTLLKFSNLRAKSQFWYDFRTDMYADRGEGESVTAGPAQLVFSADSPDVQCDFDKLKVESKFYSSSGPLLSRLTEDGAKDREDVVRPLMVKMLCEQIRRKITGQKETMSAKEANAAAVRAVKGWGVSGFHYAFLGAGVGVGAICTLLVLFVLLMAGCLFVPEYPSNNTSMAGKEGIGTSMRAETQSSDRGFDDALRN